MKDSVPVDPVYRLYEVTGKALYFTLWVKGSVFWVVWFETFLSEVEVHDLPSFCILKHHVKLVIVRVIYDLVETNNVWVGQLFEDVYFSHCI